MASTYTYDITNDIGKVRLYIGDNDIVPTSDAQFSDEELQVFIDLGGSVLMGAALALRSWAASLSDNATAERIGDYSYTKKEAEIKSALADKLEAQAASIPVSDYGTMDLTDIGHAL